MATDSADFDPYDDPNHHHDLNHHDDPIHRTPIDTEDQAADLVRLMLSLDDIVEGAVVLLLCDPQRRPVVPVLIEVPPGTDPEQVLENLLADLGQMSSDDTPSLVFARARPGQSFILDDDRRWHDSVLAGCARSGISLLSAFVITQHAAVPFPPPVHLAAG